MFQNFPPKKKGLPCSCHYEGMVWIPMIYRAKGGKQSCLDHIGVIKSSLSTGSGLIKGRGKVKGKLCSTCTYIYIYVFLIIYILYKVLIYKIYIYIYPYGMCIVCTCTYLYIYIYLERYLYLCVVAMGDGFNHVTAYSCLPPYLKGYITQGPNIFRMHWNPLHVSPA